MATMRANMEELLLDILRKFEAKFQTKAQFCPIPWLDAGALKRHENEMKAAGKFGATAAAPLMAAFYSFRVCRPDIANATRSLARRVHRWTAVDSTDDMLDQVTVNE